MPTSITTRSTIRVAIDALRSPRAYLSRGARGAAVVILLLGVATAAFAVPEDTVHDAPCPFQLGRDPSGEGYRFGGFPLWFAGDATIKGAVPENGRAFVELDDVSLLLRYEPTPRLSFFTETLLENTVAFEEGRGIETGSGDLSIERLYADIALTPQLTLRAGKLLTPFGIWNVIRRAPLSWTVERPVVTEEAFPEHTTGLNLIYQTTWRGWSLDATAYGPAQDQLAFRQSEEGDLLFGGRFATGHSFGPAFATVGLDAASFEDRESGRWAETYGADFEVDVFGQQIIGEIAYNALRGSVSRALGAYVQDAIPLASGLYGVLRFDYFQPRRGPGDIGGLIGIFWRPYLPLIVKLDYQFANRQTDDLAPGLLTSVSLFF